MIELINEKSSLFKTYTYRADFFFHTKDTLSFTITSDKILNEGDNEALFLSEYIDHIKMKKANKEYVLILYLNKDVKPINDLDIKVITVQYKEKNEVFEKLLKNTYGFVFDKKDDIYAILNEIVINHKNMELNLDLYRDMEPKEKGSLNKEIDTRQYFDDDFNI